MNMRAVLTAAVLLGLASNAPAQTAPAMSKAARPASASAPAAPASAPAAPAALPLADGKVTQLDPAQGLIVLRHGELPALAMGPMTMGFQVADPALLRGLKVGDRVRFQAAMVGGEATITQLRRTPPPARRHRAAAK